MTSVPKPTHCLLCKKPGKHFVCDACYAEKMPRLNLVGPIECDDDYDRTHIPLPGGWEVQTKGNGSSFRIVGPDNFRLNITRQPYLYEMLEKMARDIHAKVKDL